MKLCLALTSLLAACALSAQAAESITLSQPGPNHALVKVTTDAPLLMLPIRECLPDAKVQVIRNGSVIKTLYARLAPDTIVDFCVPLDLKALGGGRDLLLDIVLPEPRSFIAPDGEAPILRALKGADSFDTANREAWRPAFHHTPSFGWMNDPNGMVWHDGRWHLFYQYNPYGSKWQNMTWGHSSSSDLVNWQQHPLAIEPDALGSVFSGCTVIDAADTAGFGADAMVALFTSAGTSQTQSLAHSTDGGETFTRFPGNPVVTTVGEARDPNIFFHAPTGKWIMLLAHALDHEMLVYSSDNLKDWTFESAFGKDYGCQEGVWECPDLFELPVRGSDATKWVLVCNINPGGPSGGSAAQYFVGDFDGHTFTCDSAPAVTKWMDYGKDHYAAVSFSGAPDGRHTTMGWMSNWEYADAVPTVQYRGANTLPRDHDLFRGDDGELYLGVHPARELEALRRGTKRFGAASVGAKGRTYMLPASGALELDIDLSSPTGSPVQLVLANAAGEEVAMTFDPAEATFAMDRTRSGVTSFSDRFPAVTTAPLRTASTDASLRIFIDRSSIEAFDGLGRFAMTNLVFPSTPYDRLTIRPLGSSKVRVASLTAYPLAAPGA